MNRITLRHFTEEEYHAFFRGYEPDPVIDPVPFVYDEQQISKSYQYNHDRSRENYCHYGIFLDQRPVGSFQLKRIDMGKERCEFGIILQNEAVRNKGIGTAAIRLGIAEARNRFGIGIIAGDTLGRNKRMQRVFDKLGFQLKETRFSSVRFPDGTIDDCLIYEKMTSEDQLS